MCEICSFVFEGMGGKPVDAEMIMDKHKCGLKFRSETCKNLHLSERYLNSAARRKFIRNVCCFIASRQKRAYDVNMPKEM
jgi:hypothetical protein